MKSLFVLTLILAFTTLPAFPLSAQSVSTLATNLGVDGDGIFATPDGDLYVAGGGPTSVVLRISSDGTVSTFASGISGPVGIFRDSAGEFIVNNYRVNTVTRISPNGEASTLATGLNGPAGVVVNASDEILVSEFGANFSGTGAAVRKVSRDGTVEPFITGNGLRDPIGIAVDDDDIVYVANWNSGEIFRSDGETTTLFAEIGGRVNQIAYGNGYLYVPSPNLRKIFRIDSEGTVEHIAGAGASGTADGPALEATFGRPNSIAVGPDGRTLYIIDADAQSVRVLHLETDTAVDDGPSTGSFTLDPLYPNPFNGVSNIRFSIHRAGPVRLTLQDLLGREVAVLVDDVRPAGTYERPLNASGLSAGVYACRLTSGGRSAVRLITLVQ